MTTKTIYLPEVLVLFLNFEVRRNSIFKYIVNSYVVRKQIKANKRIAFIDLYICCKFITIGLIYRIKKFS
jgi:hypothetical protein